MRQAAHAIGLVLADHIARLRCYEDKCIVGGLERLSVPLACPYAGTALVFFRYPQILALAAKAQLNAVLFGLVFGESNLPFASVHQIIEERVLDRRRVKSGG